MAVLTMTSLVQAAPGQVSADVGDGYVVLGLEGGIYFGLEDVAGFLWDRLRAAPVRIETLCAGVAETYDVTLERCSEDVLGFIDRLIEAGLAEVVA